MSEHDPTGRNPLQPPAFGAGRKLRCEDWEGLIAEALDGTLSPADLASFEQHRRECAVCAQMFEEVRRGAEWLGFLEGEPEMAPDLMTKILARTSGSVAATPILPPAKVAHAPATLVPVWQRVAPVARRMLEPRLLMTVAMAFFSIALTLNLAGIKLSRVRLADLRPSVLRTNLTRQYYSAKEQGVKYYDNLRFVYEMEARVRELRRTTETEPAPAPAPAPQKQSPSSRNGSGDHRAPNSSAGSSTSRREGKPSSSAKNLREGTVLVNEIVRNGHKSLGKEFPRALLPQTLLNDRRENKGAGILLSKTQAQEERNWA